jgi:hypothetical protein
MARPREVRGWLVYGAGVAVAFLMLAFRLYYATGRGASPFFVVPWVDIPFVIAILAGALATLGLQQALWYSLVRPGGWPLYLASLLMFVVATLFLYSLPNHLASATGFYLPMFTAAVVLFAYTPTLSYGSRLFNGVAAAGVGVLVASSLYGPATGAAPITNPLIASTIAAEGLLLLLVLRLLQVSLQGSRPVPA